MKIDDIKVGETYRFTPRVGGGKWIQSLSGGDFVVADIYTQAVKGRIGLRVVSAFPDELSEIVSAEPKPEFKVGDAVVVVSPVSSLASHKGKTGRIKRRLATSLGATLLTVRFDESGISRLFYPVELAPYEEPKPEPKFKRGDEVVVTNPDPLFEHRRGHRGTVTSNPVVHPDGYYVRIEGNELFLYEHELSLAPKPEPKFKDGERVVVGNKNSIYHNHLGTVQKLAWKGAYVLKIDSRPEGLLTFGEDEIESVEGMADWELDLLYDYPPKAEPEPKPEPKRNLEKNQIQLTIDFDGFAWAAMSPATRQSWIDDVVDAVNNHAYVSEVRTAPAEK